MAMKTRTYDTEVKRSGTFTQVYIYTRNESSVLYDSYISVVCGNYRRPEVLMHFQKRLLGNWNYDLEITTRRPSRHPSNENIHMTELATWNLAGLLGWREAGDPQIFWCGRSHITLRRDVPAESVILNENVLGASNFFDLVYKLEQLHARAVVRHDPYLRKITRQELAEDRKRQFRKGNEDEEDND